MGDTISFEIRGSKVESASNPWEEWASGCPCDVCDDIKYEDGISANEDCFRAQKHGSTEHLIRDIKCSSSEHYQVMCDAVHLECAQDPSLNAAAHSMSVEGENGAEHDAVQKPVDDMNPIALTLIGAVVVVVIALLFVMMRGRTKKEQTAKETVAEMSEVVDAPNVVHVADDTVEVPTESAVAEPSIPETTANGMEEAVEVKVNTESV